MRKILTSLAVTVAVTLGGFAVGQAQDAAELTAKPVVMLAVVMVPGRGAVVVTDDLTGDKGRYADMKSCSADMLHASGALADDITAKHAKVIVLDMICFDVRRLTSQDE